MQRTMVGLAAALVLVGAGVAWWRTTGSPGSADRARSDPAEKTSARVTARALGPATASQPPADDDGGEPIRHGQQLRGQVFAQDGGVDVPVSGARVSVDTERRDEAVSMTDERGAFSFEVDPDSFRALRVEAKGFLGYELTAAAWHQLTAVERALDPTVVAAHPVRVVLLPGREVSGQVSAEGRGLARALVQCVHRGLYNTPGGGSSVLSDEEGRFTVTCGFAAGGFKVVASHPAYRRAVTDWLEGPPVSLELVRGVRLRGKVLDRDGETAEDVLVQLTPPEKLVPLHHWQESRVSLPPGTRTGPEGEFEFEPALGSLLVVAEAHDGTRAELAINLEGTGEQRVELRLSAGDHVGGVVTLDGQPAAGVTVGWRCGNRDSLWPTQLTDQSGTFRLNQLTESGGCFVVAQPGTGQKFLGTQTAARIGDEHLRLALNATAPGSLRIGFSGAYPDYSGAFTLTPTDSSNGTNPVRKTQAYFPTRTVAVTALPPGRYRLSAKLEDGMPPAPVEVDISANVEASATLTVPDGFARGQATGRVVDAATGQPLAGADAAFENGRSVLMGKTAPDGTFKYDYAAERIAVVVSRAGYEQRRIELAVGAGQSAQLGDIPLKAR